MESGRRRPDGGGGAHGLVPEQDDQRLRHAVRSAMCLLRVGSRAARSAVPVDQPGLLLRLQGQYPARLDHLRSEEHTSELQSLMRISYAVFCLKKKNTTSFT